MPLTAVRSAEEKTEQGGALTEAQARELFDKAFEELERIDSDRDASDLDKQRARKNCRLAREKAESFGHPVKHEAPKRFRG